MYFKIKNGGGLQEKRGEVERKGRGKGEGDNRGANRSQVVILVALSNAHTQ
jgi:hypothetical protein